ncbi:MAG TPA: response regulator [Verrucomicrobiae bacterium]
MNQTSQNSAQGSTDQSATQILKRKRILVADSDGFTRLVLIFLFRMVGFGVDFSSNGAIALGKLRSSMPDALVLDLKLSGLPGLELIKRVRRPRHFRNLPIYVFTRMDLMNRATRKELPALVTKVFDKRYVSRENVVETIIAELAALEAAKKAQENAPEPQTATEPAVATPPSRIDELVLGVSTQSELLLQGGQPEQREAVSGELRNQVGSLKSCAETSSRPNVARQAKALEGFLERHCSEGQELRSTDLETLSRSVEVLGSLACDEAENNTTLTRFTAAVVDESAASSQSISEALQEAGFNAVAFEDPAQAVAHLAANPVDLVVANLPAAELHGLDLPNIRQLPLHAETPVIFVAEEAASDSDVARVTTTAPQVNTDPLLRADIVMKALNEVQGKEAPSTPVEPEPETEDLITTDAEANALPGAAPDSLVSPLRAEGGPLAEAPADLASIAVPQAIGSAASLGSAISEPANGLLTMPAARSDGKKTILFVEDDPFALKVYRKGLKREGFHVEVAEDGLTAIDKLPGLRPDLVVLDLMLPKVPGLDVLKFMRAESTLKDIPVIVLSNAYMNQLAANARRAGANKGLSKTECSPARLVDEVRQLLGNPTAAASAGTAADAEQPVLVTGDCDLAAETAIWTRQAGLQKAAPKEVATIRQVGLNYIKAADDGQRVEYLAELYRRVRFLSAHAALIGFTKLAEVSSALEGLLFEIVFKQAEATSSTYQTIARAVDCLDRLVQQNDVTFAEPRTKPKVLVVDDDAGGNFDSVSALKRGNFEVVGVQDPFESLRTLKADQYDLVLLDINMPQLDGFAVCEQLRRMPKYKSVPVIFNTTNIELQHRARSVISGGNDLIPSSVSPLELILRVTMHLLKSNGHNGSSASNALAVADTSHATTESNLTWSVEEIFKKKEAADILEASATMAEKPQEPEAESPVAANAEGEAILENRLAGGPDLPTEEPGQGPREVRPFEMPQPPAPVSESATELNLEPIPVARAEVEPAPERQIQTEGGAQENSETFTPESTAKAAVGNEAVAEELKALQRECAAQREVVAKYEKERETLVNRIVVSENDLHRAQARLERKEQSLEELQKQLAELAPRNTQLEEESQARCAALEKELAELRQARAEFENRSGEDRQASAESARRTKELEEQLNQRAADLEASRTEFEQLKQTQACAESDLRAKLDASNAALGQAQERVARVEQELTSLHQAWGELNARCAEAQQVSSESGQRVRELEQQLDRRAAEWDSARTEWEQKAKTHDEVTSDLRRQLEVAGGAARQSEAAHAQAQARCSSLEQELADLHRAREALNARCADAQQMTAESGQRIKALEDQLTRGAAEVEEAKAGLEKQTKAHEVADSDLRRQLDTANAAAKESELARQQTQARYARLEKELADLQQAREDLSAQHAKEQKATTALRKQLNELETYVSKRSVELERVKVEAEKQQRAHAQAEADLRARLDSSNTIHQQAQSRVTQLEQELTGVRQAGEELNCKFAEEQKAGVAAAQLLEELETNLNTKSAELERARADFEKQQKAHAQAEADLRARLDSSSTAHQQAQSRVNLLERDLAGLRQAGEELNCKFAEGQKAGAASAQRLKELETTLNTKSTEYERARTDFEKQRQAHAQAESDLRARLDSSSTAHQQAQSRVTLLEQELAGLRQAGEELNRKLAKEQKAGAASAQRLKELETTLDTKSTELERAQADFEKQQQAHAQAEADLRARLDSSSTAHQQAQSRVTQLEQQLGGLLQASEELNCKFAEGQKAGAASAQRLKELETTLNTKSTELERARADFEKQQQAHAQAEAELRARLDSSSTAHQQAQSRVTQLEQDLAGLRQAGEELNCKFAEGQKAGAASAQRLKELEATLNTKSTELERARADFEKQQQAHAQAEAELRARLDSSSTAHQQAQSRVTQLEQDLAGLRQAGEELNRKLAREHRQTAESAQRLKDLERQLQSQEATHKTQAAELEQRISQGAADLTRATADLANERGARQRSEERGNALNLRLQKLHEELSFTLQAHRATHERIGALEANLRQREETIIRRTADFEQQLAERRLAEERLEKTRELNAHLRKSLSFFEAANKTFNLTRQNLESRLETTLNSLQVTDSRLQGEVAERQRVTAALDDVRRELQGQNRKRETLETELQATIQGLRTAESTLQQEAAYRQRLAFTLDGVQRDLQIQRQQRETLESQLQSTLEALKENESKLQTEAAERQRLALALDGVQRELQAQCQKRDSLEREVQTTLQAAGENESKFMAEATERQRLALTLEEVKRELQTQRQKRGTLETELQAALTAAQERESRFDREVSERRRLQEALESTQGNLRDQAQRTDLEVSRLQSALQLEQVERKRQESQIVRCKECLTIGFSR